MYKCILQLASFDNCADNLLRLTFIVFKQKVRVSTFNKIKLVESLIITLC